MAKNFASLAFTDAVKALQEKHGSRSAYAKMEKQTITSGLSQQEMEFIAARDSFYIASTGENGFPYIQHRGGPKGFLKVLDANRLGFVDYRGNMQYITIGNIATQNKVALILVDYPARARLKIYARASVVELKDDPALFATLDRIDYKARPERMIVLEVEAYDWNCPQHITPRYTAEDIEEAFAAQREHIASMQAEIKSLRQQLKEKQT